MYRIAQNFDGEKLKHGRNFDEQNFDELTVASIGKVLTEKIGRENFDELLAICQSFPPSKVLRYTVIGSCIVQQIEYAYNVLPNSVHNVG